MTGDVIVEHDPATWRVIARQLRFGADDPVWLDGHLTAIADLLAMGGTRLLVSGWDADILSGIATAIAAERWLRAQQAPVA